MPRVSIIVPCYNEQATIGLLLQAIEAQTYPHGELEVVIADGLSSDGTRDAIAEFQREHPDLCIRVVDNLRRVIPAGVNRAIEAARGEFLVRLDAHSMPCPDYVARCVAALEAGLGDNVGGVWEIRPAAQGGISRSIALAAAHPLGVGDARYRLGGKAQAVDTVPFGSFRCSLIERIGCFDETLLTNEDYEFNVRVRQSGGRVWFDPSIRSTYFARSDLPGLARQYWRYGYWKARMLQRYPRTLRLRQMLPPVFILSLLALGLVGIFWPKFWLVLVVELSLYLIALIIVGVQLALQKKDIFLFIGVPLAIATMHWFWGGAFLWSILALSIRLKSP